VIDGQHRTHAAALRGIEKVPCQIVLADRKLQARAFAGMNGNQAIRLQPYQVHRAALLSGDAKAIAVDHVCSKAGICITTNLPADQMERGDTVAVATIYRAVADHGAPLVIKALEMIASVGDGNVGCVNALAIKAYCSLLARRTDILNHGSVLDMLDDFDLAAHLATAARTSGKQSEQREALAAEIETFLDTALSTATPSFSSSDQVRGLTREPQTSSPLTPLETSP
jgi:hypothetical protein